MLVIGNKLWQNIVRWFERAVSRGIFVLFHNLFGVISLLYLKSNAVGGVVAIGGIAFGALIYRLRELTFIA